MQPTVWTVFVGAIYSAEKESLDLISKYIYWFTRLTVQKHAVYIYRDVQMMALPVLFFSRCIGCMDGNVPLDYSSYWKECLENPILSHSGSYSFRISFFSGFPNHRHIYSKDTIFWSDIYVSTDIKHYYQLVHCVIKLVEIIWVHRPSVEVASRYQYQIFVLLLWYRNQSCIYCSHLEQQYHRWNLLRKPKYVCFIQIVVSSDNASRSKWLMYCWSSQFWRATMALSTGTLGK